jgi:hypothetical protein
VSCLAGAQAVARDRERRGGIRAFRLDSIRELNYDSIRGCGSIAICPAAGNRYVRWSGFRVATWCFVV